MPRKISLFISFDPNYRAPLWDREEDVKEQIAYGLSQYDVLKIADNEIALITGAEDFDQGAKILVDRYPNIKLLNVTVGENGSYSYYNGLKVFRPITSSEGVIETTGVGDTFCASVLNFVLENGLDNLEKRDLEYMLTFANAAAYLVTTKKGTIRSMPEKKQIEDLIQVV